MASATPMKRRLNSSRVTGWGRDGSSALSAAAWARRRVSRMRPSASRRARQPGARAIWVSPRTIRAGPSRPAPSRASAAITGAGDAWPPTAISMVRVGAGAAPASVAGAASVSASRAAAASTSTWAMRTGEAGSVKPNRRWWASAKAWAAVSTLSAVTGKAASAPAYFRPMRTCSSSASAPCSARSARTWSASRAARAWAAAKPWLSSGWSSPAWRRAPTRAWPMPQADSRLAKRGLSTSSAPRASATQQAIWPAAPPKATKAWPRGSKPRSVEMRRTAWAVSSTATRTKPSAAASGLAAPMAWASSARRSRAAAASRGWSWPGPNRAGKLCGSSRPSTSWASVTVAGPPRP